MSENENGIDAMEPSTVLVNVDFSTTVDYPLIKTKFPVYNSGIVSLEQYRRDIARFTEVKPESLRIDMAWGADWGKWEKEMVSGTIDDIQYDFTEMDELGRLLNEQNVLPYWSYCYMFKPLQKRGEGDTFAMFAEEGDWRSFPTNVEVWTKIVEEIARHFHEHGPYVGYHEIFNEPDLHDNWGKKVFFSGTRDQYFQLYLRGVQAIRRGDPEALVGGPALAYILPELRVAGPEKVVAFREDLWVSSFLDLVTKEQLPLDFFSFHHYGTENMPESVASIKKEFLHRQEFPLTEIHLNEYNSYIVDYPDDGPQERYQLASAMLKDYKYFLTQPYLTKIHWAQFLDSGQGNFSGMVTIDGHRKALFNTYKIYKQMPVDRRQVMIEGAKGVEALASSDLHNASIVLWNCSGVEQTVKINMAHIGFPKGSMKVYRIDSEHCSWGDKRTTEELVFSEIHESSDSAVWTGSIMNDGIVYLEIQDGSGFSELDAISIGRVVRTLYYYPDRASSAYADFDKNTWIARLGMVEERVADLETGVTAEDLPAVLRVEVTIDGTLKKLNENSLLGLRIDYQVEESYTLGILYHGTYQGVDLYDVQRSAVMPWGTQRQPDRVIEVKNFAYFDVALAALAPAHWSGRVQITVILQNAGESVKAKAIIRKGE